MHERLLHEGASILLRLLSPITPHICHYLWNVLGYEGLIINAAWPKVISGALVANQIEIVVQVNGKLRDQIQIPADADAATVEEIALSSEKVQKFIA